MIKVMRCPKCNCDIDEKMLVCPNCKKVLKLVCPKCKTVNKSNTCVTCGFAIISKCYKCGKINQTIDSKCSKCGFSTYTSVAIASSNIDEFACVTIEFPNLRDIKAVLGSTRLVDKFKANLDRLILNYTSSVGVKREIIENVYIIRFNKDASFRSSAKNAVQAAIEIQNAITELNYKLKEMTNASLTCNIAVLKRDIHSKPENYKSGFDIKLIYQHQKELNLLNNLQIITDAYVYEQVCDDFDLSVLTAKFIKNEMMTFFELNLKKYIKIPKPAEEEEDSGLAQLNILGDNEDETQEEDELYEVDAINFNELKCTFTNSKSINIIPKVISELQNNPKKIISIKGKKEFMPNTDDILKSLEGSKLFKNVFRVICYDDMKYKPYGFFYDLISSIYVYSVSPRFFPLHDFNMFKGIDSSQFIQDLITLNERKFPHPEDVRYSLFDIFLSIFGSMENSVIYIENFEKIDGTSKEVLHLLFERFNNIGISYVISSDKDYSLHKDSHFLLANPNYIEVTAKPTPFKDMVSKDLKKYELVLDSYHMQKISQNAKGSVLYFQQALEFLLENELLYFENGVYKFEELKNVLIPSTLNELIEKRLQLLQKKNPEAHKFLSMLVLMGPMTDFRTIKLLELKDEAKLINELVLKKHIYSYNNIIYIPNYNLYFESFFASTTTETKQEVAQELMDKVFGAPSKHPVEATLYNILGQSRKEFMVWEYMSRLNASLGDFGAYLNCSIKFLKLLDNHVSENSQKSIEEYKLEVYENISNLLYKYVPNEIHNITQIILNNLEKTTDDKKVINLCNKMLQGCLIGGNYSYALELIHKILSRFQTKSINPKDENFDSAFFLISLVKIEVLFSIGNLKDCVEAGDEILNVIDTENLLKLKPKSFSDKQFEEVVIDGMIFVAISRVLLMKDDLNDFIKKVQTNIGYAPRIFDLFLKAEKLIRGETVRISSDFDSQNAKFGDIVVSLLNAFVNHQDDYKTFAEYVYQAKISARMNKLTQIELICDSLIGYSYFMLNQDKKASLIYYNVLETSGKNGLKMVTLLAWLLMSMLKFKIGQFEIALGIVNNAIVQLEKDSNSSDFLLFLFRVLLSKILMAKEEKQAAELCLNNAKFIKDKYGLKYKIGE